MQTENTNTKSKSRSIDMLHGPLLKSIIYFAMPIALAGMLQQLFNLADVAVVGHFADKSALAAVGINGEIVALIISFSTGLAVGVNVLIARFIGSGKRENIPGAIRASWYIAIIFGILVAVLGQFVSFPIIKLIDTPEAIMYDAALYLRLYILGYPFLLLYDFGSAIMRADGDSRRPLIAMTISGLINMALNLFLVIVFHMGVAGVAIATDISTAFSAFLVLFWLYKMRRAEKAEATEHQKVVSYKSQDRNILGNIKVILQIGVPAALQGAVFCFANIFVQAAVNSFGTDAVAGSTAAMNYEYLTYYIVLAFGQAATTFTGQNFAAHNLERCKKILFTCMGASFVICGIFSFPLAIFKDYTLLVFSSDPSVIRSAGIRILFILLLEPFTSGYECLSSSLRGMGYSLLPAIETIVGTCLFRIVWIMTVFQMVHTEYFLYLMFPITWIITSAMLTISYRRVVRKNEASVITIQEVNTVWS